MWITDLIIEIQKRKTEIVPKPEKRSRLKYLDIDGFLKRQKMRRVKERR